MEREENELRVTDRRRVNLDDQGTERASTETEQPSLKPSYVEELETRTKAAERQVQEVQARFVDDPRGAVTVADSLVTDVMQLRGYPIGQFEQRAADLSVDYPMIVDNYRAAHDIALRHSAGKASTEDLRQAMVHYRALFQELLE